MNYKDKTEEQLINESAEPCQRIEDLEAKETKRKEAEEALRKAYDEMDLRVKEQTEDLVEANQQNRLSPGYERIPHGDVQKNWKK